MRSINDRATDLEEIIDTVNAAYDMDDTIVRVACEDVGDTLANFIHNEIISVYSPTLKLKDNIEEAIKAMTSAQLQLSAVIQSLEGMREAGKKKPSVKPSSGEVVAYVEGGVVTGARSNVEGVSMCVFDVDDRMEDGSSRDEVEDEWKNIAMEYPNIIF